MSDEPQQTIFRSVKNKDFTTFSNSLLRDARLSFKARGVLAMCLSMPPEWKVYRNWLVEQGKEGREAVQGALQELEQHGYVKYIEVRRGGQFVSSVWEFHEVPVSDRTNRTNWTYPPLNGKPSNGKPSTGNPSPKKDCKKEETQKEELILVSETKKPATILDHLTPQFDTPEFKEAWEGFVEHRKKVKAPLTSRAILLLSNDLRQWGCQKSIASIDQTVKNGKWTGLFEPKDFAHPMNGSKTPQPPAGYPDFIASPEGRQYATEYPRWATIPPSSDFVKRDFHNWVKSKA